MVPRRAHLAEDAGVDQRAVLDAMAGVGARVGSLGLVVGVQHHVDGEVAVGVDADLEPGPVHLHHVFFDFPGAHGQYAVVAVAADVRFRQVGGAGGDGPVGNHLDAAQAQHIVAESGLEARFLERAEVGMIHKGVHPHGQVAGVPAFLVGDELVADDPGVVDAGEAGLGKHPADGAQPFAPNLRGIGGNQPEPHVFDGPARRPRR